MQLLINVLKIYFESNANGCQGKISIRKHISLLAPQYHHTQIGAKDFFVWYETLVS